MNVGAVCTVLVTVLGTAGLGALARHAESQARAAEWTQRTPWGDLDLQGEWTTEGEFGVPLERPAEFASRAFLTDEEYAKRLADVLHVVHVDTGAIYRAVAYLSLQKTRDKDQAIAVSGGQSVDVHF